MRTISKSRDESRAALREPEITLSQPSTFDPRPSTSAEALNSGVPTPLAPLGLLQKSQSNLLPPVGGFSLVEIVIAIGIAAFCLVAIFGLIPAGLKTNKESLSETMAAGLASRIAADLRSTPTTLTNASGNSSFLYAIKIPISGGLSYTNFFLKEDGSTNSVSTMGVNYRATVIISNPNKSGTTGGHLADVASILITWPAAADPTTNAPTNFTGSYGTAVGLDRN